MRMRKSRQLSICFAIVVAGLAGCNSGPGAEAVIPSEQVLEEQVPETIIQETETVTQSVTTGQTQGQTQGQTSDITLSQMSNAETSDSSESAEPPAPIEQTVLSVTDAETLLRERFGEDSKIVYLPDMDKQEEGILHYCFSVDYSHIFERETAIIYAWINSDTGDETFQEKGYTETGSLYTNIPDPMFPVPMSDGTEIPYAWFIPPGHDGDVTIYYMYEDLSILDSYRGQLEDAGFIDYGTVMSVESLWQYERAEDGATLVLELYTYDDAFGVIMYVNYLNR